MKNKYLLPFSLITSLFFLWGIAHNLNPILIPHLKKACQLTDFQSAFIDSAFFAAYFAMALPAGWVMNKFGYKFGIIAGLILFAAGAFLFIPAANVRAFGLFLGALFVIASGLTFLETAANPYTTVLGDPAGAEQRINFAQSFNGLAAGIAPLIGGEWILTGVQKTQEELAALDPAALNAYLNHEAEQVKIPYLIIGLVVLAVALLLYFSKLPEVTDDSHSMSFEQGKGSILRHKQVFWGILAQFFYVGAQVCVSSFFIRYLDQAAGMDEKSASRFLSIALFGFMAGRFIGTFLMRYISAQKLLMIYAIICMVLLAVVVTTGGMVSAYALIGVEFFMSIMFPTIFSLSIKGLGSETKTASSYIVMSIVGGALIPLVMGKMSDILGNIQVAYVVPLVCFVVVWWFGRVVGKEQVK